MFWNANFTFDFKSGEVVHRSYSMRSLVSRSTIITYFFSRNQLIVLDFDLSYKMKVLNLRAYGKQLRTEDIFVKNIVVLYEIIMIIITLFYYIAEDIFKDIKILYLPTVIPKIFIANKYYFFLTFSYYYQETIFISWNLFLLLYKKPVSLNIISIDSL